MAYSCFVSAFAMLLLLLAGASPVAAESQPYTALVTLFQQWREFERPVMKGNVPDYSPSAIKAKEAAFPGWRKRLEAINPAGWPIEQQNDYKLVKAEMNGLDFDFRVLRPWARDPAFYVSIWPTRTDVPSREPRSLIPKFSSTTTTGPSLHPHRTN